jgi:hypothetical protein
MKSILSLSLLATAFVCQAAPAISGVDSCKLLSLTELKAAGLAELKLQKADTSLSDKDEAKAPSDIRSDMCTYYIKDSDLGALAVTVVESFAPQVSGQAVSAWLRQDEAGAESKESPAEERKRFGVTTCERGHYPIPSVDGKSVEANQAFVSCSRRVGRRHLMLSLQTSAGGDTLPSMEKTIRLLDTAADRLKKAGKGK